MFAGVNPVMTFNISKTPLVKAQLSLLPAANQAGDGLAMTVVTEAVSDVWQARLSTTTHKGHWTNSDFGGDAMDWRNDVPGWATAAVVPSPAGGWEAAAAYDGVLSGRAITPEALEATTVIGTVAPISITTCPGTGCYLVVMAELFTGWIELSALDATPGTVVTISYSTNKDITEEFNQQARCGSCDNLLGKIFAVCRRIA
jgi:hypothetical protein